MSSLNLSGRVAALLAGAAVVVVLLAGWILLISPQRSKAANLSSSIDQTQAKVVATQAYVDSPVTKLAVKDLPRLKAILPDDPKMSQILRQLSAAAGVAGVELDSISPSAALPSGGGEAVPISLSVTGHYFNISRFLQILRGQAGVKGTAVRGSGRLYSTDTITFSGGGSAAPGAGDASTTISASIALNAFIYSVAPATAVTTTPGTTSSDTSTTTTTGTTSP
jgi:hypothetical protein